MLFRSVSQSRYGCIRNNSVIPILWYDDIRKYIGRLRKWFLKEYGEKIRYYIICEYGTQSFRRIITSYYSTTRLKRDQILGMFGLCQCPQETIQEKFVLNSIWLNYGSMVIRLQRLPMVICKNTFLSILHNILISLECLTSFHKGVFTQSYWVQRARSEERRVGKEC